MSAPMTFQQAGDLLKLIREKHSPFAANRDNRVVKYVDPHFDMRTGHCFALTLRGYGWEQHFHTQNECRDLPESLYERVVAFIEQPTNYGQSECDDPNYTKSDDDSRSKLCC